ncbi:MAG TPA: FG-GAP-like repeat-containing protein, partial [Acidimicrobiales bacterium]|nr:FG-GAP-like repeat-containing protein [Acidimicrobiales bacterium]
DFVENDNDPLDLYGHGTGRAGIAAAAANGIGMVGVCPYCSILPVRTGYTFVATPDRLAEGISYAADRGAVATVLAGGSLGNSDALRAAVDYADSLGMVQCIAMGNENNRHPHFPQSYENVVPVAGLTVYDSQGLLDHANPADWSASWKGSDFGGHAVIAAPLYVWSTASLSGSWEVDGGTSSATPHCGGVVGLMQSRARDLGIALSARQVKSILISTADDYPAWSAHRGYGRLNARKAVLAVSNPPPPSSRIISPHYYQLFGDGQPITVSVSAPVNSTNTLEMGYGVGPTSWTQLPANGVANPVPPPPAVSSTADTLGDSYAVTFRLTSTSTAGAVTLDRRTVYVHSDPDTLPGFPIPLASSLESAPLLTDLDGDNRLEIVALTGDGSINAWHADGTAAAGWPVAFDRDFVVHTDARAHLSGGVPDSRPMAFAGIAAGDLDGDGRPEIVATALDGRVYAFHGDGTTVTGFPVQLVTSTGGGAWASPVLADLEGTGSLDIIVAGFDRRVHALRADGTELPGWPVTAMDAGADSVTLAGIIATPAVGDIDGDGTPDVIVATSESQSNGGILATGRVYAFHHDGTPFSGWPVKPDGLIPETFPVVGSGVATSPVLADLDGDGLPEVIVSHAAGLIEAFDWKGKMVASFDGGPFLDSFLNRGPASSLQEKSYQMNAVLLAQPAAADLGNSGRPDVFLGTMGLPTVDITALNGNPDGPLTILQTLFTFWRHDGTVRAGFPRRTEGWALFAGPTVADLDADTLPEVIAGSDGGWLHAWDGRGKEPAGFPKFVGGWLGSSAAVGDLFGDGKLEVVIGTREGQLFAWKTPGAACVNGRSAVLWPGFHHDPHL